MSTWSGELDYWSLGAIPVLTLLGVLIIPFTVGTFMTMLVIISPIAAIAGAIRGNWTSAGAALAWAVAAFLSQLIVGAIRKSSAP
jgi:hypothetical protein